MVKYTRGQATLSKILEAAGLLFLSRNYADVTMSQIAETAAVTKGAVYHHFASKEQLYLALLLGDLAEKKQTFGEAIDPSTPCRQQLADLTLALFSMPAAKRHRIRLVRRDVNVFAEADRDQVIRAYQEALPEQVQRVLEAGISSGELAPTIDARLLAWQFVALVEVVLTPYAATIFGTDQDKVEHVLNLFFGGAGNTPPVPTE